MRIMKILNSLYICLNIEIFKHIRNDVAHSIGVQNGVLHFFLFTGTDFKCSGHFFCFETRGVRLPC